MKFYFSIIIILLSFLVKAQDTIVQQNQKLIVAKISEINENNIVYKRFNNLSGPTYTITKSEVLEVLFENGTSENYKTDAGLKEKNLDETKDFLVRMINKHCFEKGSTERRYKASFEENYLRLIVMNKEGTKPVNKGLRWDFSYAIRFQHISKRGNNIAFINVKMSFISNEKKDTHKKTKLVIQVLGHDAAHQIVAALTHLNKLLLIPAEQF